MTRTTLTALLLGSSILGTAGIAMAQDKTITIESWRTDDLTIWQEKLIPAFEAANPGIKIVFSPTNPPEYDAALGAKLEAGSAGDIITCRPFDKSLELYKKGQLADLTSLPGMDGFSDVAKSAWQTDDGSATFCVPMASVIHGFIYNKDAFDKLGIAVPATRDEFFAALDKIKADGTFIPMAMGTKDQWEAATMGYQNIGPNYWKGEEGRQALIKGEQKLTDAPWVEPYAELAKWKDYLGDGFEAQTYSDSQNLFTLGRAAIYPAGSWEIGSVQHPGAVQDGRLPAARRQGRRHLLHLRPHRHRHRPQPEERECGCGEDLPFMGRFAGIRHHLRQRAAGLLQPVLDAGEDGGSARPGIRVLAREVPADDPLDLSDPGARHAEPRDRDLGRVGQRHQRHRHARGRGQEAAGRPRQLVQAGEVSRKRRWHLRSASANQMGGRAPPSSSQTPSAR